MLVFIEWVVGCETRVDKSREDNRSLWSALKKDVILSALKDMGVSAKDGDIHIGSCNETSYLIQNNLSKNVKCVNEQELLF